jgi:hypothetical protein
MTIGDTIKIDGQGAEITRIIGTWSVGTNYPDNREKACGLIVNAICGERSYRHVLVDGRIGKERYGWTTR